MNVSKVSKLTKDEVIINIVGGSHHHTEVDHIPIEVIDVIEVVLTSID